MARAFVRGAAQDVTAAVAAEREKHKVERQHDIAALRICTDALLSLGADDVLNSLVPHIGTPVDPTPKGRAVVAIRLFPEEAQAIADGEFASLAACAGIQTIADAIRATPEEDGS